MADPLALFWEPVAAWFRERFGDPTPPQTAGWPEIAAGRHALVVAPTGSGKTLTAFFWSLDRLIRELSETPEPEPGHRAASDYQPGIRVVYVSPLKALGNDVERNLIEPLRGIRATANDLGVLASLPRVAVRTGDTPANERQKMLRQPPQILITTPESLYLMLSSPRARALFATTHTAIVDEIHTLVGTKRGAHLALSLERLERLARQPVQRVGLSATVRPVEEAARFLGGQDPSDGFTPRPVSVVDASYRKPLDLRIVTPLDDFRDAPGNSVWSAIIPEVARLIDSHRTTLIFCNNRRLAERTADRLNEQRLLDRLGDDGMLPAARRTGQADLGMFAVGIDAARLEAVGLQPIRAHHGSMSKTARLEMERALKSGELAALVCTSSLELGIDVGDVDLVVQLQSPKSVASGLQRVGRSGHRVGQTSVGRVFPTHVDDLLEAAAIGRGMRRGEIEAVETPANPLDVLAQQLVAMVGVEDWDYDDALALVRGACPFRDLGEGSFRSVVEMLAGRYPESVSRYLKALIGWDRVANRLTALPGTGARAIGSGGTIPDRGAYALVLKDRRTRIGELDEEFVFETRPGDAFLLGSHVWRALEITDDRVVAEPAPGEVPRMPFWRGDSPWRPYDLGRRVGAFRRELAALVRCLTPDDLAALRDLDAVAVERLASVAGPPEVSPSLARVLDFLAGECGLDRASTVQAVEFVARQLEGPGKLASDRTIVVERFEDALGEPRLVVQSPFGGRVNGAWAVVLAGALRERLGVEAQHIAGDDGIILRFANAGVAFPADLVGSISSREARERLLAELPGSATFGAQFRANAARALLLPRERAGRRTPLWLSRLRAKDLLQAVQGFGEFPILLETYRDCLRDVFDLPGLTEVLDGIQRGEIEVVVHDAAAPSPVALGLDYRLAMQYVYEYDAPRGERQLAALSLNRELLAELLRDGSLADLLRPEAIQAVASRASRLVPGERARDPAELAQLLYELGDLSTEEVEARCADAKAGGWLQGLADAGLARQFPVGPREPWIHHERLAEYARLRDDPGPVLRRYLAHAGPTAPETLADRYGLDVEQVRAVLAGLDGEVVSGRFAPGAGEQWIARQNLEQIHRQTLAILRKEVAPVAFAAYARFVQRWQRVGAPGVTTSDDGGDEDAAPLRATLQRLRGIAIPGAIWERDVLPARVPGFDSRRLAGLFQTGELLWVAEGGKDPRRARVRFLFRGEGGLFLDRQPDEAVIAGLDEPARVVYDYLRAEGAAMLVDVTEGTGRSREETRAALVALALAGLVSNDTLDALRLILDYEPPAAPRPPSALEAQLAALRPTRPFPPGRPSRFRLREARRRAREVVAADVATRGGSWPGRWALVHRPSLLGKPLSDDERALRQARLLLLRWGVVTRACLDRESPGLSWERLYPVLARLELRGEVRRGYFVEGLPGAQFALPEAVEQLRASRLSAEGDPLDVVVLNATDPAQLYGGEAGESPLRFARLPTTAVATAGGELVAAMEDSGAAVEAVEDHPALARSLEALARWWKARARGRLRVDRWNGGPVLGSSGVAALERAGFVREFDGMLWMG